MKKSPLDAALDSNPLLAALHLAGRRRRAARELATDEMQERESEEEEGVEQEGGELIRLAAQTDGAVWVAYAWAVMLQADERGAILATQISGAEGLSLRLGKRLVGLVPEVPVTTGLNALPSSLEAVDARGRGIVFRLG